MPIELRVLSLRDSAPEEKGSVNLNDLVAKIESRIAVEEDALNTFRERLLAANFIEHDYYKSVAFGICGETHYRVSASFPKLVVTQTPIGIVSASYSISISSINKFVIGAVDLHE